MKITKFIHSCLLIEEQDRVGIIDPGVYSWESGLFNIDNLEHLDDIMITHQHPDHLHLPFIKALLAKFPNAIITSNPEVVKLLEAEGIKASDQSSGRIELFQAEHGSLAPLYPQPANVGINYLGHITHPGDSHSFDQTKETLALPVTAPWGTVFKAAEIGKDLRPKHIIPIHDWHYRDEARAAIYSWLEPFFKDLGINFIKPQDGVSFVI